MWSLFTFIACSGSSDGTAPDAGSADGSAPRVGRSVSTDLSEVATGRSGGGPRFTDTRLTPAEPTVQDDLVVVARAEGPDGRPVDVDIEWQVNGQRVGSDNERLSKGSFERDDEVTARVTADADDEEVEVVLGPVRIVNSDPLITTRTSSVTSLDRLQMRATDADGDRINWRLEDAPYGMSISSSGEIRFSGSEADKGGNFRIKVVADDGAGGESRWEFMARVDPGEEKGKRPGATSGTSSRAAQEDDGVGSRAVEAQDVGEDLSEEVE